MPTRTGTPSQVDASGGNGSTSVTVPGGATGVTAFWSHWDGNGGSTISALTLNGVAFTIGSQLAEGAVTDKSGVGVAYLVSPSTGSQTLAWTWSGGGARTEGGEIILVYVADAFLSDPVRDSGTAAGLNVEELSITVDSEATDLVLAFAISFTATNPGLEGSLFLDDETLNSHIYDCSEVAAGAGTTTVDMTDENYSTMAVIVWQEEGEGGGGGFVPDEDYQIFLPVRL